MTERGNSNTWEQRGEYLARCHGLKLGSYAKGIDIAMAGCQGTALVPAATKRRAGSRAIGKPRTSATSRTRTRKPATIGT